MILSARFTASAMSWSSSRVDSSAADVRLDRILTPVRIIISGFLTSWAIPAAIRPIESSFSDWMSCSWVARSSAWYRRTSPNQPAPRAMAT